MATHDIPILGAMTVPDNSGTCFFQPLETGVATAAANLLNLVLTMEFPTGTDLGVYGKFNIPQNYVDTPLLIIRGVIEGVTGVLAFGVECVGGVADSETVDAAFETADLAENSTWTGYADEEMYEETITMTPAAAYVAGDEVFFHFFRDDSQDTTTFDFHVTGLLFRYNDA